jgi:hypothetical protein
MNWFTIYIFTRLDSINDGIGALFLVPAVLGGIVLGFCGTNYLLDLDFVDDTERWEKKFPVIKKWYKRLIIYLIVVGFIWIITPNTKEFAAIYLIPKIVNNEQVQQVPDKALNILSMKLDEWINDLNPKESK